MIVSELPPSNVLVLKCRWYLKHRRYPEGKQEVHSYHRSLAYTEKESSSTTHFPDEMLIVRWSTKVGRYQTPAHQSLATP